MQAIQWKLAMVRPTSCQFELFPERIDLKVEWKYFSAFDQFYNEIKSSMKLKNQDWGEADYLRDR